MQKLINILFECADTARIFHLQTKMFSSHKALNEFYDSIIGLTDEIVEKYQGKYSILEEYEIVINRGKLSGYNEKETIINYFLEAVQTIETYRYNWINESDTYLHNILDEIVSEFYSLLYKLRNLM